jgi:8-oxo-dGTP pyrophosphatase MutT (NUDIX family)
MPSSYLIPYFTTQQGVTQFLVGQKQVISYEAIAKLKERIETGEWNAVMKLIAERKNPLAEKRKVTNIGARLDGVLLPAGGKPTFLGGGIEGKEDRRDAAIREFEEEFGFINLKIDPNSLEMVKHFQEWGGTYYPLNLDEYPGLIETLDIDKANARIKEFEKEINMNDVYENRESSIRLEEMHRLYWIDNHSLEKYLSSFPDGEHVISEVKFFCALVFNKLNIKDNSLKKKFFDNLVDYMIKEPIDDNIQAAKQVIKNIREQTDIICKYSAKRILLERQYNTKVTEYRKEPSRRNSK